MSYKDKTFCEYYESCHYGYCCHRALTKSVKEKVPSGVPVSVFDKEPECFEEKINE